MNILFVGLIAINFTACFAYSFTGASVPEHLKTIAIPIADDRSGSGQPGLRENLTQTLIRKFIGDNTFQVSERTSANALLECSIISLSDAPAIVSAINSREDSDQIWATLWQSHLSPALTHIAAGKNEEAYQQYREMVEVATTWSEK